MGETKLREDVHTTKSERTGALGQFESFVRKFKTLGLIIIVAPLMLVSSLCLGLAMAPALFLFDTIKTMTAEWPTVFHYMAVGCGFSLGYLVYGLSLIFIVPAANFLLPFKIKEFRGPYYSLGALPWYVHNALTYIVRYTFLEFVTPTPLNILFYRMMGMKIGKGVVINTTNISDPGMITLGDYVTVGGSVTMFGHYGQKGYLIIAPVHIGEGTNIGLKASVMGGCEVGKNVMIKPHACLMPKTKVGDNESI